MAMIDVLVLAGMDRGGVKRYRWLIFEILREEYRDCIPT